MTRVVSRPSDSDILGAFEVRADVNNLEARSFDQVLDGILCKLFAGILTPISQDDKLSSLVLQENPPIESKRVVFPWVTYSFDVNSGTSFTDTLS